MKSKFLSVLVSFIIITAVVSCNKEPQTEMDLAKSAVNGAKTAGADVYLPAEFDSLSDSLNLVLLKIEARKSKWFASYKDEKAQLTNVIQYADKVKQNTEVRKNEIKNEILATMGDIRRLLDENQQLLLQAPKGKEGTDALIAIKDEMSVLNATLNEIMQMVEAGDYINANSKTAPVNDKAVAINSELKMAIEKYARHQGHK